MIGNRRVAQLIQAKRLTPDGKMIGLQRKLTVGAADDQYEQEADRVARQVLNTSAAVAAHSMQRAVSPEEDKDQMLQTKPLAASITPFVQRQMVHNEESEDKEKPVQAKFFTETSRDPLQRQPDTEEDETELIQAKSAGALTESFEAGADVETQVSQSKGRGSPLPDAVRTYMEPRFGVDFSQVRVHTGSAAIHINRDVGAQAFTHGSDIYFGEGHSPSNLELTAHELTHVVQQTGGAALTQDTSSVQRQEYRKYKATFHASPPSGASQHPASNHPAPRGATPQASPEHQLGSLAGSQQAAIRRPEYSSRLPDDGGRQVLALQVSAGQRLLAHEVTHTMQQQDGPTRPGPHGAVLQMQRLIGNRAVQAALQRESARGVIRPRPTTVGARAQEADETSACAYEAGEKATAIDRGILATDVQLITGTGSGYNAAPNSIVVADFRPESAVVRTSTAEELHRRAWISILERQSLPYALLGFTDCVGEERNNQKLRAGRANAVAALLPKTARQASVIGAAPAADFLMPGNSTRSERALNRAVLIRLPFEELRQAAQVDEYSADAVRFWQSNKTSSVADLINFVSGQAGALLDRNRVPRPDVLKDKVEGTGTLAFFNPKDWAITLDVEKMTSASPQGGVTQATMMSALTVEGVAALGSTCYHEFRHAEQHFLAARQAAADAKGGMSPKDLAQNMNIPLNIADEAVSASLTPLPDKYQAQARAWRTTLHGGRHFGYKKWNDKLRLAVELVTRAIDGTKLTGLSPGSLKYVWEKGLRKFIIDGLRDLSIRGDALLRSMTAGPDQDPVDDEIRKALTKTNFSLFMVLVTNHKGKNLADTDALTKMSPEEQLVARLEAQQWLSTLTLHLLETKIAADDAYRAYPVEAEAYQSEELVKQSIKQQGSK
jgi:outer membrane protein OmpA-like peptidoglycan-associated protein